MNPLLSRLWWLLLLAAVPLAGAAQPARLEGTVTDAASGEPLAGVNVSLQNADRGAVTDLDGHFEIPDLAPGAYTLQTSYVGYETATRSVTARADATTRVAIALTPEATDMDAIVVEGRAANLDRGRRCGLARPGRAGPD